jgi:uncharacterized membrane protein YdjX (TVP38/TMEM64 family)
VGTVLRCARRIALVGPLGFVFATGASVLAARRHAPVLLDPSGLRRVVARFGPLAPAAFVSSRRCRSCTRPSPDSSWRDRRVPLGGVLGAAYSLLGVAIGGAIAFHLARRFGRPAVERLVTPDVVTRFDDVVDARGATHSSCCFSSTFPDDVLCFLAGLSRIDFRTFLFLVVVGRAPTFVLVTSVGADIAGARYRQAGLFVFLLLALSVSVYVFRDRLAGISP